MLGTAAYLSPEQASGEPATPASDLYALAVVAYELLAGDKPFTAPHFAAQARAHIEDPPPPAPGLPRAAQQVLDRGLAKDPADRWPTATAFVEALDRAMSAPAADADTTRAMGPPPPPVERTRAAAAPPPVPSSGRGRRGFLGGVVAALVVAAIVAVALASGGGDDDGGTKTAGKPTATATAKAKKKKKPAATDTATPAPTASPSPVPTASPEPTPAPEKTTVATSGDPAALNQQGFDAINAGDYEGAIEPLQGAVDACAGGGELDPCGFAYYNLATALIRTGRGKEAKPLLKTRLKVWGDNENGDVKKALKEAK